MRKLIGFLILAIALISCQPQPEPAQLYDQLVVSTNAAENVNFSNYATYAIATDTIGFLSNDPQDDTIYVSSNQDDYPTTILDQIRSNLNARGFTRIDRKSSPDLGVNVTIVKDFNVFQQVIYPSYNYYPGSYYSGYYGYGSAYYYPYVSTSVYRSAVLVIELVDLKNRTPDNKVQIVWNAYLGDLYSVIDRQQETISAIDQAFKQSSFIKKGS
jgi:hypothetical protein